MHRHTSEVALALEQRTEPRFPFTAIVGQTAMKRALLLNAINPKIGGVLIRGKKGTAKSTAVRSLGALLPEVTVVRGCPYSCPPEVRQGLCQWGQPGSDAPSVIHQVRIVDLPVGATEDRLVGSLDIEEAIKTGAKSFEPGLIAAAHRGVLYIDEVNLLNDHLVDVLLDAAAMGRNYVEREGVSISHAAEFILVGTMNPEEGELLAQVRVSDDILELITDICAEYQVDGLRGDIVMYKTASTIASYEGRTEVAVEDVREAAQMALLHRQRRQPFQQPRLVTEQLDSMIEEHQNRPRDREPEHQGSDSDDRSDGDSDPSNLEDQDAPPPDDRPSPSSGPQDQWFETDDPYSVQSIQLQRPDRSSRKS